MKEKANSPAPAAALDVRIERSLARRGLDRRQVYWRWRRPGRDRRTWILEASDPQLESILPATGSYGFRRLQSPRKRGFVVTTSTADLRREPSHETERVSEFILGDRLECLLKSGRWWLVRGRDGYLGWIRSWSVAEMTRPEADRLESSWTHRIVEPMAVLRTQGRGGLPLTFGTPVEHLRSSGSTHTVRLPSGERGEVPRNSLEAIGSVRPSRRRAIDLGKSLLGIPYLWGGTSSKGFDCSGYVQRVFGYLGIVLPRDADQQYRSCEEIREPRPADLCFFGKRYRATHVGICLGRGRFLHAYGRVQINSVRLGSRDILEPLRPLLLGYRKVLP